METLQDLWTDLGARLRRYIDRQVNDSHAAEDIAQEVMLKLQAQMGSLPPEDKLPAWTLKVARNTIIDYYRARAVRDRADVTDVEPAADAGDEDGDAARDLTPCLVRMVEHLPEPYRAALKLADFEGVGQQELADRVGMSLSGAKSRVQRARRQLRDMLQDCCNIERDGRGNVVDFERTERSGRYCAGDGGEPRCGR